MVTVRKSEADQDGAGRTVGIPSGRRPETHPVRAWLDRSRIGAGPLFREVNKHGHVSAARLSDRTVADVVKRSLVGQPI